MRGLVVRLVVVIGNKQNIDKRNTDILSVKLKKNTIFKWGG